MIILTVTEPFGDYAKGAQIADAATVAAVLESHPAHVVRVEQPDPPQPAPSPVVTPAAPPQAPAAPAVAPSQAPAA